MNQTHPAAPVVLAPANPVYHPTCSRCDGRGRLPEYNHVQGGVCFRCGGSGQA